MTTSENLPLLIEIGCEEIPARFLTQAQTELGNRIKAALEEARLFLPEKELITLSHGEREGAPGSALADRGSGTGEGARQNQSQLQTYSTPRRLVAYIPAIIESQPDKVEEITGPPVKVAVDAAGKYTRAADSFAQKNSATVGDLTRITTPKGEYLAVKKTTRGRPALEVLSEILPAIITGISFPKSMYWTGKSGPRFVRPIRWMIALLGEGNNACVVPFEVAGVKSGDFTFGHRTMVQSAVQVSGFKDYVKKLHDLHVELEPERRLERVRTECKALLEGSGLRVVADKDLEDWIVNSTEWPRGLVGSFDERYLKLPREILVTVMRDHQKYFAVEDEQGNLRPSFLNVLNVQADPQGIIRRGHERVLTARFSDAEFFWNADLKIRMVDRQEMLKKILYAEGFGSYAAKVRNMETVANLLSLYLGLSEEEKREFVIPSIRLCKCDLTTQMVAEFPELQGIVGGLCVKIQSQSKSKEIADAIYDHYLPMTMEDRCPRTIIGTVVSLADKLDTLTKGFQMGREPSGSSDPFGLRRAGNGIIKLLLEKELPLSFPQCFTYVRNDTTLGPASSNDLFNSLTAFLRERLRYYLETVPKFRYDSVRAVLSTGADFPVEVLRRVRAIEKVREEQDLVALAAPAKRIKNILAKSATNDDWQPGEVDCELLESGPETALNTEYSIAVTEVEIRIRAKEYEGALERIATLRIVVDTFFEKVLVMANDKAVRQNRLRLLGKLDKLFSSIADLSEIESHA